jgi:hypothetical protein
VHGLMGGEVFDHERAGECTFEDIIIFYYHKAFSLGQPDLSNSSIRDLQNLEPASSIEIDGKLGADKDAESLGAFSEWKEFSSRRLVTDREGKDVSVATILPY